LTAVAQQIPVYTGLVGQAQAENRFGHPVAGAYLRQASDQLTLMLTETGKVIAEQSGATESGIDSASSFAVVSLVVLLLALATLWLIGRRVARSTHRRFNPWLVGAAAVLLGLFVWSLASYSAASGDANLASADFSGVKAAQTQASWLSLAETDIALQQIERGEDQGSDAKAATSALQAANPAAEAGSTAGSTPSDRGAAYDYTALAECADHVIGLANDGQYVSATTAMVGTGTTVGSGGCELLAQSLYTDLQGLDNSSQTEFDQDMSSLAGDYAGSAALAIGLAAGLIGAAVAATGLNRRLAEYR
jgi:hypothetical protein